MASMKKLSFFVFLALTGCTLSKDVVSLTGLVENTEWALRRNLSALRENEEAIKHSNSIIAENGLAIRENTATVVENLYAVDDTNKMLEENRKYLHQSNKAVLENIDLVKEGTVALRENIEAVLRATKALADNQDSMTRINEMIKKNAEIVEYHAKTLPETMPMQINHLLWVFGAILLLPWIILFILAFIIIGSLRGIRSSLQNRGP